MQLGEELAKWVRPVSACQGALARLAASRIRRNTELPGPERLDTKPFGWLREPELLLCEKVLGLQNVPMHDAVQDVDPIDDGRRLCRNDSASPLLLRTAACAADKREGEGGYVAAAGSRSAASSCSSQPW